MRRLLIVATLCGCGRIAFDARSDAPTGTGDDGMMVDTAPDAVPCVMPAIFDAFAAGGAICGAWGGAGGSMTNSFRSNGLHIIPPANSSNVLANCTADPYAGNEGAFISISKVTTLATGYIHFGLFSPTHTFAMNYMVDSGEIEVNNEIATGRPGLIGVAYNPVTMRWWRMHVLTGGMIAAEVSPDGMAWNQLATTSFGTELGPADKLTIGAGYYGSESTTSETIIDVFNVCP